MPGEGQTQTCLGFARRLCPPALPVQVWEGGVRVPAFVHAPGRLAPRASAALVHVSDWTPTLVGLAGGAVEPGLDGLDVWQALQQGGAGPRDTVPANINPLCHGCVGLWGSLWGGGGGSGSVLLGELAETPRCLPFCCSGQFGAPKAALRVGELKLVCWCYEVAGVANGTRTGCVPDPSAPPQAWPQASAVRFPLT